MGDNDEFEKCNGLVGNLVKHIECLLYLNEMLKCIVRGACLVVPDTLRFLVQVVSLAIGKLYSPNV
jgi:hypothetical protein